VHDFIDKELGKVIPYGVYDTARNEAWVSVASTTTPRSLRRDRSNAVREMARRLTPEATSCWSRRRCGSNAYPLAMWRVQLQQFRPIQQG